MGSKRRKRGAAPRMPIPPRVPHADHRRRRRWRYSRPLRVAFSLAALGALALFINSALAAASISAHRAVATATVVNATQLRGPNQIDVQFQTPDGRTIKATFDESGPAAGDTVEVEYDSRHPDRARLRSSSYSLVALAYYGLLSLVFAYGAVASKPSR